jgi:hypothetical protein
MNEKYDGAVIGSGTGESEAALLTAEKEPIEAASIKWRIPGGSSKYRRREYKSLNCSPSTVGD